MTSSFQQHNPSSVIQMAQWLLPGAGVDTSRWPVLACDQHTSDPDYWAKTRQTVGKQPSTLHVILPEVYLETESASVLDGRIQRIHQTMARYLAEQVLEPTGRGCFLIERRTPQRASRLGLVVTVDLEQYDYRPENRLLIRATEETVADRLPPRSAIRQAALFECAHVQLLMDDPRKTVLEPVFAACTAGHVPTAYDITLMQAGGAVRGWFLPEADALVSRMRAAMNRLDSLEKEGLLLVVGDGNHSLAAAKDHWDRHKDQLPADHPARFAMVEVMNLHDDGLSFEPIHRVLTGIGPTDFQKALIDWFEDHAPQLLCEGAAIAQDHAVLARVLTPAGTRLLTLQGTAADLPVALIQPFLDHLVESRQLKIDYIHGLDVLQDLVDQGAIGIALPALQKDAFFSLLAQQSVLPRKTFSLGEANEKRYYLECRMITQDAAPAGKERE